jgi:hypothetical protein
MQSINLPDLLYAILAFLSTTIAGCIGYEVHRARESIAELNANILVLINRVDDHARRIAKIEDHLTEDRKR